MRDWSRRLRPVGLALAMLCFAATGCGTKAQDPPGPATVTPGALTCTEDQITESGLLKTGHYGENEAILANGRRLTPAGEHVGTGRFPLGFRVNAAETRAYVVHNADTGNALMVLDLVDKTALQVSRLPTSPFKAVALSMDEKTLYVGGGHSGKIYFYNLDDDGLVTKTDDEGFALPSGEILLGGYIADLEVSPDGALLFAVANTNSKVHVLDTATLETQAVLKAGTFPYDMAFAAGASTLWFSNVTSSTVSAVDTVTEEKVASIPVGKNPMALALSPDEKTLYVTGSDTDEMFIIDTTKREMTASVDLSGHAEGYKHGSNNGIAVSPDGTRVYVTEAQFNHVNVLDAVTFENLGAIPTGWYPTEVAAGTKALYVVSSKGMGSAGPTSLKSFGSFLSVIPYPDDTQLEEWTDTVEANNNRTQGFFKGTCTADNLPVLAGPEVSPIKHVVLVVKENKTYDMILGDFERGDGDPNLVVFGEDVTPNIHKIAREFVNFDNFYTNAEASVQGHMWTSSAHCNDYQEKMYWDQFNIPGYDIGALSYPGSIFDHCFAHGVSFRNYGEFPAFGQYMFDEYMDYFDSKFPFYTQSVLDVDKAAEVIREIELGIFPQFLYMLLPNDHTYGGDPGKPTPRSMVADNDRGLAMIVDYLSKSIYWPETVIFVIQDDPQGSGDHVDPHRSILVAISPWVKRGYTSSVHYDVPSLYRTIEMILGLPPMGKNDAMAAPILDIWREGPGVEPDYTPFDKVPVNIPQEFNPEDMPADLRLDHCKGAKIDGCEGLGRILWKMQRGDEEPPPYAKGIDW